MMNITTQARVRELFDYREGTLYWKSSPRSGWVGKPVTHKTGHGYVKARVDGKLIPAHRLVWLWHNEKLPELIDHINGVRHDNRIENLRACTEAENARNKSKPLNNTTGHKNVIWSKQNSNFNVQLTVNKRKMHLGVFDDIELAALVAEEARDKFYGKFARQGV
jgi:hypothetical protein